tara:strand:- start:466 stop:666 length:201 start_codon:yes stop_codon:yes gene_type:complete
MENHDHDYLIDLEVGDIVSINSDALCDFAGCSGRVVRLGEYVIVQLPDLKTNLAYQESELTLYREQ